MKVLTKEQEQAHYNETVKGGLLGLAAGSAMGGLGIWAANRRFPAFRQLTVPFRAFLVASSGTFTSIIAADRYSRAYDAATNPEKRRLEQEMLEHQKELEAAKTRGQRIKEWAEENRYPIIFGSWVASMAIAFGLVSRNPYLTGQQKLVQARVYAQGLTVAVLLASFAFETNDMNKGKGRWETIKVLDPKDPTHKHMIEKKIHHERYAGEDQWREMVEAEEARMNARKQAVKEQEKKDGEGNNMKH